MGSGGDLFGKMGAGLRLSSVAYPSGPLLSSTQVSWSSRGHNWSVLK